METVTTNNSLNNTKLPKTEMVTTRSIGNLCPGLSQEQAHGGARQVNVIIIPLYLDVQH